MLYIIYNIRIYKGDVGGVWGDWDNSLVFLKRKVATFLKARRWWLVGSGGCSEGKKGGYERSWLIFFENGGRWLGPKQKTDKGHFFCLKIG